LWWWLLLHAGLAFNAAITNKSDAIEMFLHNLIDELVKVQSDKGNIWFIIAIVKVKQICCCVGIEITTSQGTSTHGSSGFEYKWWSAFTAKCSKAMKRLQNEEGTRIFKNLIHLDPSHFVIVKAPGI
jgi:hypothetical protein